MHSLRIKSSHLSRALSEIGTRANKRDVSLELAVCHKHCIAVVYLAIGRPVPIAVPNGIAQAILVEVSDLMRMPAGWMTTELTEHLIHLASDGQLTQTGRAAGVQLSVNESARVLAHKLSVIDAATHLDDTDAADASRLLHDMRDVTVARIEAIFRRYRPDADLSDAARELIDSVMATKGIVSSR